MKKLLGFQPKQEAEEDFTDFQNANLPFHKLDKYGQFFRAMCDPIHQQSCENFFKDLEKILKKQKSDAPKKLEKNDQQLQSQNQTDFITLDEYVDFVQRKTQYVESQHFDLKWDMYVSQNMKNLLEIDGLFHTSYRYRELSIHEGPLSAGLSNRSMSPGLSNKSLCLQKLPSFRNSQQDHIHGQTGLNSRLNVDLQVQTKPNQKDPYHLVDDCIFESDELSTAKFTPSKSNTLTKSPICGGFDKHPVDKSPLTAFDRDSPVFEHYSPDSPIGKATEEVKEANSESESSAAPGPVRDVKVPAKKYTLSFNTFNAIKKKLNIFSSKCNTSNLKTYNKQLIEKKKQEENQGLKVNTNAEKNVATLCNRRTIKKELHVVIPDSATTRNFVLSTPDSHFTHKGSLMPFYMANRNPSPNEVVIDVFTFQCLSLLVCQDPVFKKETLFVQMVTGGAEYIHEDNPKLKRAIKKLLYLSEIMPKKYFYYVDEYIESNPEIKKALADKDKQALVSLDTVGKGVKTMGKSVGKLAGSAKDLVPVPLPDMTDFDFTERDREKEEAEQRQQWSKEYVEDIEQFFELNFDHLYEQDFQRYLFPDGEEIKSSEFLSNLSQFKMFWNQQKMSDTMKKFYRQDYKLQQKKMKDACDFFGY